MGWVLSVFACMLALVPSAALAAARSCQPPALDVAQLYGKSPREVRGELAPLIGAPVAETNQLPDGGTFAKLEVADVQDGVTQRYNWGYGAQGSVEVVFQRGRAQLVSVRLEEFETVDKGVLLPPCGMWPRDALAQRVGLFNLPKKALSARTTRGLASNRYDVRLPGKPTWTVRMRCHNDHCVDVNVYFPGEPEPRRDEVTLTSTAGNSDVLPPPPDTPPALSPKKKPAPRRPLRVRR